MNNLSSFIFKREISMRLGTINLNDDNLILGKWFRLFLLTSLLLLKNYSFSQNQNNIQKPSNGDIKTYIWDVSKTEKGSQLLLNVEYKLDFHDSIENLTLRILKEDQKKRPNFISIIASSTVIKSNSIYVVFGNKEAEKENPIKLNFDNCDYSSCTSKLINGYIINQETKEFVDVFQKFCDFERIFIVVVDPYGSFKTIAIPLQSFKQQYWKL